MDLLNVTVWGLPRDLKGTIKTLHETIIKAVISIPETGVKVEDDMNVELHSYSVSLGIKEKIRIEVTDIAYHLDATERNKIATAIGKAVKGIFPESDIFCKVRKPNPGDGSWSSK